MSDFCMFVLHGKELEPSEVSRILAIDADSQGRQGDKIQSKAGGRERTLLRGHWSIDSCEHVTSHEIDDHWQWVISQFDPLLIRTIPGVEQIGLAVVTEQKEEVGGITIPIEVVKFAAAAGAEIDVNVDYVGNDPEWPENSDHAAS